MIKLRFPRTIAGFRRLFWILLRRCVNCHRPLLQDWALYDDGVSLWCLDCGGLRLPKGALNALRENYEAYRRKEIKP
jgi:hypothetical protein